MRRLLPLLLAAFCLLSSCDDHCMVGVTDEVGISACGGFWLSSATVSVDDSCRTLGRVTGIRGLRTTVIIEFDDATMGVTFPDYFSGGALRQTIAPVEGGGEENTRAEVWMIDHSTGQMSSSRYAREPGRLVIVEQINAYAINVRFECDLHDSSGTLVHRLRGGAFDTDLK